MIGLKSLSLVVVATGGLVLGAVVATTMQSSAQQNRPSTTVQRQLSGDKDNVVYLEFAHPLKEEEHWTADPLRSLKAEETIQQSIYLSAVQIVELERQRGKLRDAIPTLEALANRVPEQPLKNAVRRLLVDISMEEGDARGQKEAEKYLESIIEESMAAY